MAILRGDISPKLRRYLERYSATGGFVREFEWRGFSTEQVRAYAHKYARAGVDYEMAVSDDIAVLRAVDARGEVVLDTWEIQAPNLHTSVLLHPTILEILDPVAHPTHNRDAIRSGIQESITNATRELDAGFEDEFLSSMGSQDRQTLIKFLHLNRDGNGSQTYQQSGYALLHTTNAPARYSANVADKNVNRIYSTAELLSEVTNANLWHLPLPGRLQFKILGIEADGPAARTDYFVGWLKSASSENTAANGRISIQTSYEFGQWSTLVYQLAV